jgi:hypothetical protein
MGAPAAITVHPVAVPAPRVGRRRTLRALPLAGGLLVGLAIASQNPWLLVAGLLTMVLVALARPDGAVVLFAAALYLNLPVLVSQHFGVPTTVTGAFALVLLLPFVGYVVIGRAPLVLTPALGLMIAWLCVLVLSAIFAGGPPSALQAITTFLTEGLLLYVLVTNVVRTPRTLQAVFWALVLAGAAMGLGSLYQEATHSYDQTLWGFAQVEAVGFKVGNAATGQELRPRLAGPIGEKNTYARILIVLLPLVVALWRLHRDVLARVVAAGCGTLILAGITLTFSRGGAVAVALVLVAAVALKALRLRHVLLLGVALVAVAFAAAPQYVQRISTLGAVDTATAQGTTADQALVGRATENLAAFHVFIDHPVLGVGPQQFFERYSQQYGNLLDLRFLKTNRRAHNLYLEIAADTGIVGLSIFLAIVGTTMVQLWRLARFWTLRRRPDLVALAQALLLALIAYLATGLFLQLNFERYFWLLVALGNAGAWTLRRMAKQSQPAT